MKEIIVVAAIWQNEQKEYFIAQRGAEQSLSGYWEFPGGKLEKGEDEKNALQRELKEELTIDVIVGEFFMEHRHPLNKNVMLVLKAYRILQSKGELRLTEHQDFAWSKADDLLQYQLSPADIPIAKKLIE